LNGHLRSSVTLLHALGSGSKRISLTGSRWLARTRHALGQRNTACEQLCKSSPCNLKYRSLHRRRQKYFGTLLLTVKPYDPRCRFGLSAKHARDRCGCQQHPSTRARWLFLPVAVSSYGSVYHQERDKSKSTLTMSHATYNLQPATIVTIYRRR
jgi:hypothetical protein